MEKFFHIEWHVKGPRVRVLNKRIHHGIVGMALLPISVAMIIHDWKDRPWTKDN